MWKTWGMGIRFQQKILPTIAGTGPILRSLVHAWRVSHESDELSNSFRSDLPEKIY